MPAMPPTERSPIRTLRLWFHLIALLLIIAISVAMQRFLSQHSKVLVQNHLAAYQVNATLKVKQIDLRFRLISDHVKRLRHLAEAAYAAPVLPDAPELVPAFINGQPIGYELPVPANADPGWFGSYYAPHPMQSEIERRERQVAWSLFPVLASQHRLDDAIRWSGIVSFHTGGWGFYPHVSAERFLRDAKVPDIASALLKQYESDFFRTLSGTLLSHDIVWRAPSFDQAGSGYIVSSYAPVRHQGTLQGYVLADVQLNFLVALLRTDLPADMHVQIVADSGELIVDSDGSVPKQLRSTTFFALPDANQPNAAASISADNWTEQAQQYELTIPLANVDWLARIKVPEQAIAAWVAEEIRSLRQFQIATTVLLLLVWWLLSHFFVRPALQLADLAAHQQPDRLGRLPGIWRSVRRHLENLISERRQALRSLQADHDVLEQQVKARTLALQHQNTELEAFNFAVSHDMRAPLRAISGFVAALQEDYATSLDDQGRHYLARVRAGVGRLEELIETLLSLSQISRMTLERTDLDLSQLAQDVCSDLAIREPERKVRIEIEPGLRANADPKLIRIALENLLGNAWKYTGKTAQANIRFTVSRRDNETVYSVCDNGAGFDMKYAERLFTPFQRMHRRDEFEGTGVGLSTVQRIIHRHGGRIWAEAVPNSGACFYFTLPAPVPNEPN